MRKLGSLLFASILMTTVMVVLTACGEKDASETQTSSVVVSSQVETNMANPWVGCKDLEETVEKAGFDLKMPEGTNPVYRVLPEEMIEVVQSQDGKKLVYRKTLTDGDNSGDYNDYKYTGVKTISGIEVNLRGDDADKIHVAYFTAFDGTYSIGSSASMTVKEVTKLMEDWIALNTK